MTETTRVVAARRAAARWPHRWPRPSRNGRRGLQHHHDVERARRASSSSRTAWTMTGFRLGMSRGQLQRAQERHLRAVRLAPPRPPADRRSRPPRGPRGCDSWRRVERVGEQRRVAQPLDVEVGDAVGAAAGRHDGEDAQNPRPHTMSQVIVVSSGMSARATRPDHEIEETRADPGARALVGEHLAGDGRALRDGRTADVTLRRA